MSTSLDSQSAIRNSQFPGRLDSTLDLLRRRDLIELVDDGYRFQVELIRRWFAPK